MKQEIGIKSPTFFEQLFKCELSAGLSLRCHVKGDISLHVHLAALSEAGAGVPGVGGCSASVGSQERHDQGPAAQGPQASSSTQAAAGAGAAAAAEAPGGPGPSTPGPVQRHGRPQHLHVWGHERSVRGAEGPWDGQRPDGDGA